MSQQLYLISLSKTPGLRVHREAPGNTSGALSFPHIAGFVTLVCREENASALVCVLQFYSEKGFLGSECRPLLFPHPGMEIPENQKKLAMLNAQKAGHGKSKGKVGGGFTSFCTSCDDLESVHTEPFCSSEWRGKAKDA